jgi:hypothetical protein
VILAAMQMVQNKSVSLDVYSSCEVYGTAFKEANDKQYEDYMNKQDNYLMSITLVINQMNI